MSFDKIADMLTIIRNAQKVGKKEVIIPASNFKLALVKKIKECGFLNRISVFFLDDKKFLRIELKYLNEKEPVISGIKKISKQGQRIYVSKDKIPFVKSGLGVAIISTSKGLLTDKEARKAGVGGEIICEIW